jgi:hypothetical protein
MTAVTVVDKATGEILPAQDMTAYLGTLTPARLTIQHQLAAAYDAAVKSLIGPNDIQVEGGREFKKKSAWRKLARYFNISVQSDLSSTRIEHTDESFVAYAMATATAPWGQSWTDVGACGSDEETGLRTITYADAIATAMTRASNRAVSNLIAMGEVSADEIRPDVKTPATAPSKALLSGADVPMCPKCQGAMWDNRVGKKNPKAPDFKCKTKTCDGAVWPRRENQPVDMGPPVSFEEVPPALARQNPDDDALPF